MRKGLVALFICFALLSCRGKDDLPSKPGPIILISIDTLRSDHLPAYGYAKIKTPAIDALRGDSILFERAYSHSPLTLPSHAAILTGQLPSATGLHDNAGFKLKPNVQTLAQSLKTRGYATGAAVSSYALRASTGISRGFDAYDDAFINNAGEQVMGDIQRPGDATRKIAETWITRQLAGKKDQPFFYFLHLYEPHTPYEPSYDGEIEKSDRIVGDFIAFLKKNDVYDDATIVLLSDHGEGLGEHGEDEHGILLYRESLQVPLFVKLPDSRRRNTTTPAPVQLADVTPTLLAVAHTAQPNLAGHSLLSLPETPRAIVSETYFPSLHLGWSDLHSVIRDRQHLIRGARVELFDVIADPKETKDRSRDDRRTVSALLAALKPHLVPVSLAEQIPPEEAKKLAALGYLGSGAKVNSQLDPRDHVQSMREIRQASGLVDQHKPAEALKATEALLAKYPEMPDLWMYKSDALSDAGNLPEALVAAKRGLALNPASDLLAIRVADLSSRTGQMEDARNHAQLVLTRMPAEAHGVLARVAMAERNLDLAAREAQLSIDADPNKPLLHTLLGRIALARKDPAAALQSFDRAIEIAKRTNRNVRYLHVTRGVALKELGRPAEAETEFQEEIRKFPDEPEGYWNLLVLYIENNRREPAERLIGWLLTQRQSPTSYVIVADALASTRRIPAAQQIAREGLKKFPGNALLEKIARVQ
ncbi:MAG TPA: sulfatase-like hydrolase/transferase [Thermoanaerobaculia bacterium]|nr:sulfatase-like hydrolase/transferase [Thermoanaerobaculia bacterium]